MFPIFEKVFKPAIGLDPELKFSVKKSDGLPRMAGSDHFSFLQVGVPGLFWEQSRTKDKGQSYNHEHHTQHDLYGTAVPEFQKHSAVIVAIAAWGIGNLDEMLPREGLVSAKAPAGGARRMLGIQCEDDLVLDVVTDGSPAAKAGLKAGDKILKLAGKELADLSALRDAIQKAPKETKVLIKREGKEIELPVTFTE
jgi:membrane-associated protease RseP (regulator of RpoE activity)